MMCQRMGRPPTSTSGLGRDSVSSRRRVPWPPQRITTCTETSSHRSRRLLRRYPALIAVEALDLAPQRLDLVEQDVVLGDLPAKELVRELDLRFDAFRREGVHVRRLVPAILERVGFDQSLGRKSADAVVDFADA